jgi:lantibiotic modifying enzyme
VRCRSEEGLGRFYRNAGALLCLLHVLAGADCHFQNLIACGDDPVLVDAETLFQPQLGNNGFHSIAETGMLPNWRFGPGDEAYDVSSLGCISPRLTHFLIPVWTSDSIQFQPGTLTPESNVPFPSDESPHPEDYVEEMISGFAQTYRFVLDNRHLLLEEVSHAANLHVRYVFRETIEYYETLNRALESQQSPSLHLPALTPAQVALDQLRDTEVLALEQFDIPRFTRAAASRDLCGVEGCFGRSGYERVAHRVEHLSLEDLARQEQVIRLSWSMFRLSRSLR